MFSSSVGRKGGGVHGRREGLSRCFWGHGYENSSGACPGHRPRQASTTSPQSGNNFSTTLLTGKSEPLRTQMLLPPLVPSSHLTPTSAVADHVFPHLHCREWLASPFCYKGLLPHPPPWCLDSPCTHTPPAADTCSGARAIACPATPDQLWPGQTSKFLCHPGS